MDNDVFHDNTQYARELDAIQEHERHNHVPLETKERQAFVARCRRAHVSVNKLKECENEVNKATEKLRRDMFDLKYKLSFAERWMSEKHVREWRREIDEKWKEINRITESVSRKYFPK